VQRALDIVEAPGPAHLGADAPFSG
jgi:hypothetical protein